MSLIAPLDDFPENGSYSRDVDGRALLIVRLNERFTVYENSCPHTRETLDPMGGSVLDKSGLLLHCQRHAAEFVVDTGECVGGPCIGESLFPVATVVSQGSLYLD